MASPSKSKKILAFRQKIQNKPSIIDKEDHITPQAIFHSIVDKNSKVQIKGTQFVNSCLNCISQSQIFDLENGKCILTSEINGVESYVWDFNPSLFATEHCACFMNCFSCVYDYPLDGTSFFSSLFSGGGGVKEKIEKESLCVWNSKTNVCGNYFEELQKWRFDTKMYGGKENRAKVSMTILDSLFMIEEAEMCLW